MTGRSSGASERSPQHRVPDGFEAGPDATLRATARGLAAIDGTKRTIIFVEGTSDEVAVHTAATRAAVDLVDGGVVVLPIGGAHAVRRFADELAAPGRRLLGLVDHAEAPLFVEALGADATFVCEPDLEFELVRSLPQDDFAQLLANQGDLRAFSTFRKQPAWEGQAFDDQLHRWLRSVSGRSQHYAELLVRQCPVDRIPTALTELVAHLQSD